MPPPLGSATTSANFFILPSSQRNIVQTDGARGDEVDDDGDE
jgi:hypothetical protein